MSDAAAKHKPAPQRDMWADEKANRFLVPGYLAAFFGALLLSHICARCSS